LAEGGPETTTAPGWACSASRDKPIGVLAVARFVPNAYQKADADILFALANQIASVIDNAQILEQSEQREREARALYEITHLLVTLDHTAIPASLLRQLGEALAFDAAAIFVGRSGAHRDCACRELVEPVIEN
jgi:GAF domain-containing protein